MPGRGWFYDKAAPGLDRYAKKNSLSEPMDYTERDFVALAALGLERQGQSICLAETPEGRAWRLANLTRFEGFPILGVNIGCGTDGAESRRPSIELLVASLGPSYLPQEVIIALSGAPEERAINDDFVTFYRRSWGDDRVILNFAGMTSVCELTGLISGCKALISGDSGPYHMSVGLSIPTIAVFNEETPQAYHRQEGVYLLVSPSVEILGNLISRVLFLES